jgi:ABC-type transport system involved in multi-copper enzyme maturation permease subunit
MKLSARRIGAIVRKEFREYRHNRSIVAGMAVLPLVFAIQPLIAVLRFSTSASGALSHEHTLIYMLGIPTLVPVFLAAYAVAGERQQGTLEPALTTPIRREEFLLGKAFAAFLPSLVLAYAVFALFALVVMVLAQPNVASAVFQGGDLLVQVVFTPLLATWTIWVAMAISTRASDVRVAQQVGIVASLPPVLVIVLIAVGVITPTAQLGVALGLLLLVLDVLGWRVSAQLFDRERLLTITS